MTTHDIRAMSQLECLMARPKLYTPRGTLEEVLSFLEGYKAAVRHDDPSNDGAGVSTRARELAELYSWLHETAGLGRPTHAWSGDLAIALARVFNDESSFFTACRAFLASRAEASQ
jgi:hypothetical protein